MLTVRRVIDAHNLLSNLASGDDHTQYVLLAGRAGGQTLYGGTAANEDLTIQGTLHGTKTTSYVILQPSGGNVGIGTATPAYGLEAVVNAVLLSDTLTNSSTRSNYLLLRHYDDAAAKVELLYSYSSATENAIFIGGGGGTFNTATKIAFFTGATNTTATGTERMRLNSSGYLGIGTTNPLAKLNVVDTVSTSPRGILSTQISTGTDGARVGFAKARGTAGSETTIVTGDTLGRLMFRGYDGTNYLEMASVEVVADGTVASTRVPTYMAFSTATDAAPSVLTEVLRLTRSQRVGISVGSPLEKLDVLGQSISVGGDHGTWTARTNSTTKSGYLVSPHYTNSEELVLGVKLSSSSTANTIDIGGSSTAYNAVTDIQFHTAANNTTVTGTQRMCITSAGNVGIGMTPVYTLDVNGTLRLANDNAAYWTDSGGTARRLLLLSAANDTNLGPVDTGWGGVTNINAGTTISLWTGKATTSVRALYITAAGNVGIGTTSQDSLLHVSNSTTANTNTVQQLLTLSANSTGTAAAGFGSRILWELESSTTDDRTAAALDVRWADATDATRRSYIDLQYVSNGALVSFLHNYADPLALGLNVFLGRSTGNKTLSTGGGANYFGSLNVGIGYDVLSKLTTGNGNVGIGQYDLNNLTTGYGNISLGYNSSQALVDGIGNVVLGREALYTATSSNYCVMLGYQAGYYETAGNKLFIDNTKRASEADGRAKALIYGVFAAATANQTLALNAAVSVSDGLTVTATTDAALSAEYITDVQNRDFSAATDWTGTNWKIPLSSALTDVTVSASGKTFTRVSGSFVTDGFQVGMSVTWSGFAKGGTVNNGTFVITTLTDTVMTCSAATLSDEVPADYTSVTATSPVFSHAVAGANAATLANAKLTAAPANGTVFQITVTAVTMTANTLTFSIGGVAMNPVIGTLVQTRTAYVFNITATGSGVLTITPGATWLGWIDDISVKVLTPATSVLNGKTQTGNTWIEARIPAANSVAIGLYSGKNSIQANSTSVGVYSATSNSGDRFSAFGYGAGTYNTGRYSVAVGYNSLYTNSGEYTTGLGYSTANANSAANVVAVGAYALANNTGAYANGFGYAALQNNTGVNTSGFGYGALQNNTGSSCNAFGYNVLFNNSGAYNSGFGHTALLDNTTGYQNSAFGYNAGRGYTDNTNCVFLGYDARTSAGTLTNAIVIGANARGSKSNQVTLGHTDVVETVLRGAVLTSLSDAVTAATTTMLTIGHNSSGTPAANFGSRILLQLKSSTTVDRDAAAIDVAWSDATDASRTSYIKFNTVNSAASLAETMRIAPAGITSALTTTYVNGSYEGVAFNSFTLTASPATASAVSYTANTLAITASPGANSTGYYTGSVSRAIATGSYSKSYIYGAQNIARNEAGGTGTISTFVACNSLAQNYATSGTITNAFAVNARVLNYDTGIMTIGGGLYVESLYNPSGTVTNGYGIYVADQTAASTNHAIVTNAGTSVFNEGGDASTDFRVEGDTSANLFFVDASADKIKIGGTAARGTTEGTNAIDIFDGTAPVGTLANGVSIYSAAGECYIMDAAGNATLQSPHDPETGEWIFYSKNTVTGRIYRVDMERMVAAIEALTGQSFTTETFESLPN